MPDDLVIEKIDLQQWTRNKKSVEINEPSDRQDFTDSRQEADMTRVAKHENSSSHSITSSWMFDHPYYNPILQFAFICLCPNKSSLRKTM